jgi:hypothetical protein
MPASPVEGWARVPLRKGVFLVGPEHRWIESGSEVERLGFFFGTVFALGVSFFDTAAVGYSVLPLFFVGPFTAFYAKRRSG